MHTNLFICLPTHKTVWSISKFLKKVLVREATDLILLSGVIFFISFQCYHQLMFDVWKLLKTIFYLKCQKLKACLNQLRVCSKNWYQSVVCFGNWTFLRNVQFNIPLTFFNIILLNTRRFHVLPLEPKHCFTKINNKKKM